MRDPLRQAHALVLLVSAGLLLGAIAFQYFGGLTPCEMCLWQRWPHLCAIAFGLLALAIRKPLHLQRGFIAISVGSLAASGLIAIDHLGVERKWWPGHTACTSAMPKGLSSGELLDVIMKMPLQRCDVPQWTLGGLSLADFNAIFSLGAATIAAILITRSMRRKGA